MPFWAIPPSVIHARSRVLEEAPWTFTMVVNQGKVEIGGAHKGDGRAADQQKLMQRWVQWVPHVNITMSAHDGPSIMTDDTTKRKHYEAAKAGVCGSPPPSRCRCAWSLTLPVRSHPDGRA